jgi:hypothetical protein
MIRLLGSGLIGLARVWQEGFFKKKIKEKGWRERDKRSCFIAFGFYP